MRPTRPVLIHEPVSDADSAPFVVKTPCYSTTRRKEKTMISGIDLWPETVCEGLAPNADGDLVYSAAPRSIHEYLVRSSRRAPAAWALVDDGGRRLTYRQYEERVESLKSVLSSHGIGAGTRVGLLLENSMEFVLAFLAINSLDATTCPLPGKFKNDELARVIRRARIEILLVEDAWADSLREAHSDGAVVLPPMLRCIRTGAGGVVWELDPSAGDERSEDSTVEGGAGKDSDVAILMFTSGTTSDSKGVKLTNGAVVHAVEVYRAVLGISAEDSCLVATPLYHVTGLVAIIALMTAVGGCLHIQRRMDAEAFLERVVAENVTFVHASPTVFALLLRARGRYPSVPSIRILACGAAHMPISMIRALHEWMPDMQFRTVYGLTETTSPATVMPEDAALSEHIGSSGLVVPGLDLSIRDSDGAEVANGEHGEIWLRGTNITCGYDGLEDCTFAEGRWLATGDVGRIDEDGYLYVVDRIKDVVNRGGEKVWCVDVEEALLSLPGIDGAAVIGVPDALYGEVPVALVVTDRDLSLAQVRGALKFLLATHEIPVRIRTIDAIPMTPGSKVDKRGIKRDFDALGRPLSD